MKKLIALLLVLNVGFLGVRSWQEYRAHAEGAGAGRPVTTGDTNGDFKIDISDALYLVNFLFLGGDPPVACAIEPADCPACGLTAAEVSLLGRFAAALSISASGDITIRSGGDLTLRADRSLDLCGGSATELKSSGSLTVRGSGNVVVRGSTINLN